MWAVLAVSRRSGRGCLTRGRVSEERPHLDPRDLRAVRANGGVLRDLHSGSQFQDRTCLAVLSRVWGLSGLDCRIVLLVGVDIGVQSVTGVQEPVIVVASRATWLEIVLQDRCVSLHHQQGLLPFWHLLLGLWPDREAVGTEAVDHVGVVTAAEDSRVGVRPGCFT